MPQQLIYTSAPRGIVAGRSGHCTVARSALMREALMLQLEKFCYYQHLSLSGGRDRPIATCRIVDIRGTRFHVLSRIQDAGLDFTGRTNFIAHHLVFTPEEIRRFPTPPVILRGWSGWLTSWTKEPQLLENEDWSQLITLAGKTNVPAQTWQQVAGDAVNGYGLLEARAGASFRVDDLPDETVLQLFAESVELLDVRDVRRDFRSTAWNYTFTTSIQEQDNPADFRWRCIHSDNPAANRLATPDCRALSAVRATKWTGEETAFARTGKQTPQFIAEPQDVRITEGEAVRFAAKAEGVPNPTYQWFSVDRANNGQALPSETNPEFVVSDPALGISRYVVSVTNSAGNAQSRVATLSVEKKLKLAQAKVDATTRASAKPALYAKSEEDIERQRHRLEKERVHETIQQRRQRNKIVVAILAIISTVTVVLAVFVANGKKPPVIESQPVFQTNEDHSISIQVTVLGKTPLTYQWYETNQWISSTNGPILPLAKSTLINVSYFYVIISNAAGAVTSSVARWPGAPASATNLAQAQPMSTDHGATQTSALGNLMFQTDLKPLQPPWNKKFIGEDNGKSSVGVDGKTFVLVGDGENIYGKADNFFFVYQNVSNSVEFIAQLSGKTDENKSRRGIMMRESEKADAPFAFIGLTQSNIYWVQRQTSGAGCTFTNLPITQTTIFFKLNRNANLFFGAFSANGSDWTILGTNEISMSSKSYLAGFAVCSGKADATAHADFDNVSITSAQP